MVPLQHAQVLAARHNCILSRQLPVVDRVEGVHQHPRLLQRLRRILLAARRHHGVRRHLRLRKRRQKRLPHPFAQALEPRRQVAPARLELKLPDPPVRLPRHRIRNRRPPARPRHAHKRRHLIRNPLPRQRLLNIGRSLAVTHQNPLPLVRLPALVHVPRNLLGVHLRPVIAHRQQLHRHPVLLPQRARPLFKSRALGKARTHKARHHQHPVLLAQRRQLPVRPPRPLGPILAPAPTSRVRIILHKHTAEGIAENLARVLPLPFQVDHQRPPVGKELLPVRRLRLQQRIPHRHVLPRRHHPRIGQALPNKIPLLIRLRVNLVGQLAVPLIFVKAHIVRPCPGPHRPPAHLKRRLPDPKMVPRRHHLQWVRVRPSVVLRPVKQVQLAHRDRQIG